MKPWSGYGTPVPWKADDAAGIWTWELAHLRQGVVDLYWEFEKHESAIDPSEIDTDQSARLGMRVAAERISARSRRRTSSRFIGGRASFPTLCIRSSTPIPIPHCYDVYYSTCAPGRSSVTITPQVQTLRSCIGKRPSYAWMIHGVTSLHA